MTTSPFLQQAASERDRLKSWLLEDAYPLWWDKGYDHDLGGFWEKLTQDGEPADLPRRARVQPRQIYSFAVAKGLGWTGPATQAVSHGLDWYLTHYRREDGLFRTLVGRDGQPLSEEVVLYDQAFGLFSLAIASAYADRRRLEELALATLVQLRSTRAHPLAGFEESVPRSLPLGSNPHMHLFEACLAWEEIGQSDEWTRQADQIAGLALSHFIDGQKGGLREFFDGNWAPMPGVEGRIVEPGHQFEWGWLLLRWGRLRSRPDATQAALRLIEIGETHGICADRKVAINALLDDFSVHDAGARLWPQTERIKAACLAATITGEDRYWDMAAKASEGLRRYFTTKRPGLWWDRYQPDGSFIEEAAPASSFYHIVCAIVEFDQTVTAALG